MRIQRLAIGTGLALCLFLSLGASALRAEDSGAFKNPVDIAKAQQILVDNGYLAAGSYTHGSLDESTRWAISSYQSEHALNARGDLDDETFQSLSSHEGIYPWDDQQSASQAQAPTREPAPKVAQAPPVPEPTPSPAQVREARAASATPAQPAGPVGIRPESKPERRMPATGSSLPTLLVSGLLLLGAGAFLICRRFA
jgi:LPXTG-motif cell wall-anchored protein